MSNVLIVYFSRTGDTEKAAKKLATKTGWDIEEIVDTKSWKGIFGFLMGGFYSATNKTTKIEDTNKKPEEYDSVVIASPVWASNITPAIRTYILEHKDAIKKYSLLLTYGGAGDKKTINRVKELIGEPLTVAGLSNKEKGTPQEDDILESFIDTIKG